MMPSFDRAGPHVLRRVYALWLVPLLGLLTFAAGGALVLRAFAHNSSLACVGPVADAAPATCTHDSYVLPGLLIVIGLLLTMLGGLFASFYAARHLGLPMLSALQRRRGLGT
jgi:hypothetical protein